MSNRRRFLKLSSTAILGSLLSPANTMPSALVASTPKRIKPKALKAGNRVAITSPAGAVWDEKQIESFSLILKNFGFEVVLGKTLSLKHGYFAGTDAERANELNAFFADPSIKGIFCMKGGWGCARILDRIDYNLIAANPKVLIGFSDITALLNAITFRTGLITFHGPVGNSGWNAYTQGVFENVCINAQTLTYPDNPAGETEWSVIKEGVASGVLIGGNLTVLTGIIGSSYLPDFKSKILFLEEAKEEPYSIDRMLTQLKLCGALSSISGFIFGKCTKCLAEEPQKAFTFEEVLMQHIKPLGIPAVYGAMIGHIENKLTLPVGLSVTLDATLLKLSLNEAATIF